MSHYARSLPLFLWSNVQLTSCQEENKQIKMRLQKLEELLRATGEKAAHNEEQLFIQSKELSPRSVGSKGLESVRDASVNNSF